MSAVIARGFSWRHAGRARPVLKDVELRIDRGERVLILGRSGAGKSTLLAAIAGVLGDEEDGERTGRLEAPGGPVGMVLQDPDSQVISARVGDDVAFGAENLGVPREEIWSRVRRALDTVGLDVPLDHPTEKLSGGQKQRLAVAGVMAMGAGIIALDEPTANIDPASVPELRDAVVRAADASGATLLVVEHRVEAWAPVVDRIIVVGDGGIIADGPVETILSTYGDRLRDDGVWVPGPAPELPMAVPVPANASVAVETDDLSVGYRKSVRDGINITIPQGASTCITGANGAGKSTLALTLGGLLPPVSGRVVVAEGICEGARGRRRKADLSSPYSWDSRSLATRVGSVFQSPERQFVRSTVRKELLVGADETRADDLLHRLRLDHLAEANPFTLSGGEKRRLSVATVLASAPKIVLLDEPTFGQDRRTFTELIGLLRGLVDEGTTVVSVTHDPLVVAALGDSVEVLA
ncbi:ABC transporter ATP-binding protein [Corynebacterium sputi]|uniref:ABC transporter ATP-binding protein n=1 Tax=Corynebacterium sputi TaxID=489915 RepID=UPI000478FC90|nr:ABC transporter ATP-binding protein [Corynebacterium sputi]